MKSERFASSFKRFSSCLLPLKAKYLAKLRAQFSAEIMRFSYYFSTLITVRAKRESWKSAALECEKGPYNVFQRDLFLKIYNSSSSWPTAENLKWDHTRDIKLPFAILFFISV